VRGRLGDHVTTHADEHGRPHDDRMSRRWESFAQEDAEFYIWTEGADFRGSGERDAERILALAEPHLVQRRAVLEIGCGIGRILLPMRRRFDLAIGVDIAPTMLDRLRVDAADARLTEVRGMLAGEAWEATGPIDLVYSHIVLQHIERWDVIADYFVRAQRCLSPDGVFYAHLDTRERSVAYRLRNHLPDAVLPRTMKRRVRRIRRDVEDVRRLATSSGFETLHESAAGTEDTVFLLRPSR
jgi:cyclopropane fatty-acyl-phospholipid synthase-like methyltransferase